MNYKLIFKIGCFITFLCVIIPCILPFISSTIVEKIIYFEDDKSIHSNDDLEEKIIESNKFDIEKGIFHVIGPEGCNHMNDVGCLYNNNISEYGLIFFEKDESIDTEYRIQVSYRKKLYVPKWTMEEDELIIIGGKRPPKMRYFSFQNYLNSRDNYWFWRFTFASLGNSANNFRINSENDNIMIISSPNRLLKHEVAEILENPFVYFLDFPKEVKTKFNFISKIRYNKNRERFDLFSIMSRFALPKNYTEWLLYKKNIPLYVYKLKLKPNLRKNPINDFHLNPQSVLEDEIENYNELPLMPIMNKISEAISKKYKKSNKSVFGNLYEMSGLALLNARSGSDCISDFLNINCMGEISDTDYPTTNPSFKLYENDTLYVYGVNHNFLNNTNYTGIVLYDLSSIKTQMAIASVDDNRLEGTARKWLDIQDLDIKEINNRDIRDYFYVYAFRYNCSGYVDCIEIPTKIYPNTTIGNTLNILGRNYGKFRYNSKKMILPKYSIVTDGHSPYRISYVLVIEYIIGRSREIMILIILSFLTYILFTRGSIYTKQKKNSIKT
jgi:hypothetical protein